MAFWPQMSFSKSKFQSTLARDIADFLVFSWDASIMVDAGSTMLELQKKQ